MAYKDPFITDLVKFVGGKDFQSDFEAFFLKHAMEFTLDEEHKLIYSELYTEFAAKFEGYLEDFCKEKGMTHPEFMKRCRDASTDDDRAKHYINILLSSAEYETFVKLMKIMRPAAEMRMNKADAKESKSTTADDVKGTASTGIENESESKGVDDDEDKDEK